MIELDKLTKTFTQKDGQQVKRLVGAKGKGQLLQDLAEFIA